MYGGVSHISSKTVLRDIVFRSRLLLDSKFLKAINTSDSVSLEDLASSYNEPLYLSIGYILDNKARQVHVYIYEGKVIDCFFDDEPEIDALECISELGKAIEAAGLEKRIRIYSFPPNYIEPHLIGREHVRRKKATAAALDLEYIEYTIINEIIKLGYIVDTVTVKKHSEGFIVNVVLSPTSELYSVLDIAYVCSGIICENTPSGIKYGKIHVFIKHRKTHKVILDIGVEKRLCLYLGIVPRILNDYGLIMKKIDHKIMDNVFSLDIIVKRYASEIPHDPEELLRRLHSLAVTITGLPTIITLKYGLFGKKYTVKS